MGQYRLYFLDGDGHFIRMQEIEAEDDESAFAAASELDHAHHIEVWQKKRFAGVVEGRKRA
jgi:hypothetical protein